MRPDTNPAIESLRTEQQAQRRAGRERADDQRLDNALKETFPASDPVAVQRPAKPGAPYKRRQ
ncbi:hypothetical protein AB4099_08605 [Bosea sp. 2KB_26]|uniref:hypothetical protein n=1 Tax=Bosea sp. 2KB_26 TaxID=3237475 RepID=UPI003F92F79B